MEKNSFFVTGKLVDIENREVYPVKMFIQGGTIQKIERIDQASGHYILPGFIDAHVHVESSMLTPVEFSRVFLKHGTIACVSDPHEIANVLGEKGIEYMLDNAAKTPAYFYFGMPSCVPATPFETSGSILNAKLVKKWINREDIFYLSEMMNFPGVIHGDKEVLDKLKAAREANKPVDGHAPGLNGEALANYIKAGISTDHECSTYEEAKEKIDQGMHIIIREGSSAKNFDALARLIDEYPAKVMLCTDDSHPGDLLKGHINKLVSRGIEKGLDLFNLLQAAMINAKKFYNLPTGTLKAGDPADFIVVDNTREFNVISTFIKGIPVYQNGETLLPSLNYEPLNHFVSRQIAYCDIQTPYRGRPVNIIEAIDGELLTRGATGMPHVINDQLKSDPEKDILKLVVINRYQKQKPSVGFIKGFGLKTGALATTIAHDSHNIICVGVSDEDIEKAVNRLMDLKGGITFVDKSIVSELPLPIAGLISDKTAVEVDKLYNKILQACADRQCKLKSPVMTLSFMSLLVIPSLKLGDKGLFDVDKFEFISL